MSGTKLKRKTLQRPGFGSNLSKDDLADRDARKVYSIIRTRPHIGQLLGDAYSLLEGQLSHLRGRLARSGQGLEQEDVRQLVQLCDALTKLAREERAQDAMNDPSQLSSEELVDLIPGALELLSGKAESDE